MENRIILRFELNAFQQEYAALLSQVSISQCLILLDPEEAISFIEHIRNDVTKFYPGLLSKMERTLRFAQGQLLTDRINPLLLFGRDARPMARSEKYI